MMGLGTLLIVQILGFSGAFVAFACVSMGSDGRGLGNKIGGGLLVLFAILLVGQSGWRSIAIIAPASLCCFLVFFFTKLRTMPPSKPLLWIGLLCELFFFLGTAWYSNTVLGRII